MAYLLDANVFMQANRLHYGFDFCPGFWDWLVRAHEDGVVFSIEKVLDEIDGGEDQLVQWSVDRGPSFFLRPDGQVLEAMRRVSHWATGHGFHQAAVNTFVQVADAYLIAHALAHGFTVVTHEVASNELKRIKIPVAGIALGVQCMTPFAMLRRERARFVLEERE